MSDTCKSASATLDVPVLPPPAASRADSAKRRDRQAIKTGAAGVAVQVLSHGVRLAVVPLSLQILGQEQYGLWLVVGSLVAWGGVADLGLSPGLVNVVASAQGRGDRDEMRRAISTAFVAYAFMALALGCLVLRCLVGKVFLAS